MAARPTWQGHLKLSLVTCPVALYTATTSTNDVRFHLINPDTNNRIRMVPTDPDAGPVGSQRQGLQSLSGHSDAVLMALADQPLLDAADLRQLFQAFDQRLTGSALVYPRVDGQPGNPVIFTAAVRAALLACPPDVGCKQWRQAHTSQVQALDCDNPHFVQDVDTPEDIAKLRRSSGRQLQWPALWQRSGDD